MENQVGPTVLPVSSSSGTPVPNPSILTAADELMQDQEYGAMWEMDKYKELLKALKLKKGIHVGNVKCHHCKVNKKSLPDKVQPVDPYICVCGCPTEKAVVELYLVEKEILGFVVPTDLATQVLFRSITKEEWSRWDHIMGALFGYKTKWLLDPQAMKAGLLEAYNKI